MDKLKRTKELTTIYKTLHRTSADMQIKQLNENKVIWEVSMKNEKL